MKKLKLLAVALGLLTVTSAAFAIPTQTLYITDGSGISVIASTTTGLQTLTGSDGFWSVVVSTGTSYPPLTGQGSVNAPVMDVSITATSLSGSGANPLKVFWGSSDFGPTSGSFNALFSGHVVAGTGQTVTYGTYYSTANNLPIVGNGLNGASTLTSLLTMSPSTYSGSASGGPLTLASPYSIIQAVTINGGTPGGSYSLDASLTTVPDGGTTVMLLGAALSGLALLRRKIA